jgi:hypothetical protein
MARSALASTLAPSAGTLCVPLAPATALLALAAACGGKAVVDGSQGEAGGAAGGGTTTVTTGYGGSSTTTTWTGSGSPDLKLSLANVEVGIGCMPEIPPDPVYARFDLTYDNSTGTAPIDAALLDPTVVLGSYPDELGWTFAVEPPSSGLVPAGAIVTVTHEKVAGSGSGGGTVGPCSYCGAASGFFSVNVDLGPSWVNIGQGTGPIECAY